MLFSRFTVLLAEALGKPLPGLESQLRMSSNIRLRELMNFSVPADATPSSVLVLFYPQEKDIRTVFIKRPEYDGVHSGQISFPGGRREPGDASNDETALREANEEIGIDPATVKILGHLSDLYIPPSNFIVTPVVGIVREKPHFMPDHVEVDEVLEISVKDLLNDGAVNQTEVILSSGERIEAPAFVVDGHTIWGATAMMLNELKEIILSWWDSVD